MLIKAMESLPIAFWNEGFLAYRDKIIGVSAPRSSLAALRRFYRTFEIRHEMYRFCCTLNGSQSLVGKSTAILKQDIDDLPYPENPNALCFSFWEEALRDDILQYMTNYIRRGQNSELLRRSAGTDDLREYSALFCRLLGSVYDNLRAAEAVFLNGLICQPFYFGKRPKSAWLTEKSGKALHDLIYHQHYESLRTVRVLRFYSENVLLLVKPDRLRYWIRSTAIHDADETLVDLHQQGY